MAVKKTKVKKVQKAPARKKTVKATLVARTGDYFKILAPSKRFNAGEGYVIEANAPIDKVHEVEIDGKRQFILEADLKALMNKKKGFYTRSEIEYEGGLVKCRGCDSLMKPKDKKYRKKIFCTHNCAITHMGNENFIYTPEICEEIMEDMLKELNDCGHIIFMESLYAHSHLNKDQAQSWAKKYKDSHPNIQRLLQQMKDIVHSRQLEGGAFEEVIVDEVVNEFIPKRDDDGVVMKDLHGNTIYEAPKRAVRAGKAVNSSFMKFALMNHFDYSMREKTENSNKNTTVGDILDDILDDKDDLVGTEKKLS